MRKIPRNLVNPIDNVILDTTDYTFPIFRYFGLSANDLTLISIFFQFLTIYGLYFDRFGGRTISLFTRLSYVFDCYDGHYARKYNQVSKFGDKLDHYSDYIYGIFILYFIFTRYEWYIFISLVLVLFGSYYHIECQEEYYRKVHRKYQESESLNSISVGSCRNAPEQKLQLSKYLGTGTFNLLLVLLFFYSIPS